MDSARSRSSALAWRLVAPPVPALEAQVVRFGRGLPRLPRGPVQVAAGVALALCAAAAGYAARGLGGEPRGPEAAVVATGLGAPTVHVRAEPRSAPGVPDTAAVSSGARTPCHRGRSGCGPRRSGRPRTWRD